MTETLTSRAMSTPAASLPPGTMQTTVRKSVGSADTAGAGFLNQSAAGVAPSPTPSSQGSLSSKPPPNAPSNPPSSGMSYEEALALRSKVNDLLGSVVTLSGDREGLRKALAKRETELEVSGIYGSGKS